MINERVIFIESGHQYRGEQSGLRYESVSGLNKLVLAPDIDWDAILIKKAKKLGITPEELQAQWDEKKLQGTLAGSSAHLREEELFYVGPYYQWKGKRYEVIRCDVQGDLKYQTVGLDSGKVYPECILSLVKDHLRLAGQSDALFVDSKGYVTILDYKGLALDTDIPTPNGFIKMGELEVGDIVFDGDGEPTRVEHVSEIHHNPSYKITFDTGDYLLCDHEHRWEVLTRRGGRVWKDEVLTTEGLLQFMGKKDMTVRVKCVTPKMEEVDLPIDPYVLGVWLADGNSHCSVITNPYKTIWNEIENRGYKLGLYLNYKEDECEARTVLGIRNHLTGLNLIKNKHIPECYVFASYQQRLDLLRGLMDGDGYYNRPRKRCVITTTKETMADDYMRLIASLGLKPTKIRANGFGFGKSVVVWNVCFTSDISPFLSRNEDYLQDMKAKKNMFDSKSRTIKSVELIDTIPTKCISVESSLKTYLCTKSFIKTHNSDKSIDFNSFKPWKGRSQRMKTPFDYLEDCNFNSYGQKMSTYMFMALQANPHLKAGKIILEHIPIERDDEGLPVWGADGTPTIKSRTEYEIDYKKWEPIVRDVLNQYYKITK